MRYSLLCILVLLAGCASISNTEALETVGVEEGLPPATAVNAGSTRVAASSNVPRNLWVVSAPLEAAGMDGPDSLPHRGLERLLALGRFFPGAIGAPVYQDGDWVVQVRGEWFRWADGKMLPSDQSSAFDDQFLPIWDAERLDLPVWMRKIDAEDAEDFRRLNENYGFDPRRRSYDFLDALYGLSGTLADQHKMSEVEFFGFPVQIHPAAAAPLERVKVRLAAEARTNTELAAYIDDLSEVWGFYWRTVAGTNRRSFHAMGLAIDLLPNYYDRKYPYWRWALEAGITEWWAMPPREYWRPPNRVVEIFEEEGFVWGGRWTEFDTIHFEFRPEILVFEDSLDFPDEKSVQGDR